MMKIEWKVFFSTAILLFALFGVWEWMLLGTMPPELAEEQYGRYVPFALVGVPLVSFLMLGLTRFFMRRTNTQQRAAASQIDALEHKVENLQGLAERREEFIASFAHELKTPLTAVIGYADMLRSKNMPPKQQFTAAGYIFSEGKRLEALSLKLLDIIVLDKQEMDMRQFEAGYFIREVAAVMLPSVKESGMDLNVFGDKCEVMLEPDLFKTLLINLVDNARKASRRGQTVELFGRREPGGYAFYVRDAGRGISPDELEKITEAFYMVDKSRSRAQNGAGLGLALCQKIAELHKTSLEFSSEPDKGTTVRVYLPVDAPGGELQ